MIGKTVWIAGVFLFIGAMTATAVLQSFWLTVIVIAVLAARAVNIL